MAGKFIVIEGSDGSGKATQAALLADWLKARGHRITELSFPRYGQASAYFVEQYLAGQYGGVKDVGPERGSLFYALDRFDAASDIRQALASGHTVLANRYVGSNMAHQAAKLRSGPARKKFFMWDEHLEFNLLGLPRPNLNLVLLMPAVVAKALTDERAAATGHNARDIHESNLSHLRAAERTYRELCILYPDYFIPLECAAGDQPLPIEQIQSRIQGLMVRYGYA
jgi:dTMP kinase